MVPSAAEHNLPSVRGRADRRSQESLSVRIAPRQTRDCLYYSPAQAMKASSG
jgi:hypothetical protein